MTTTVRCPSPGCGELFEVPDRRLGRNISCPSCGARLTARPAATYGRLAERQASSAGSPGAAVERLPLVVLVDNVRSLWNVGSIFRTADACGVRRLVLTGITGCPPRAQIGKTALGAEDAVAWSYRADPLEALAEWVSQGYTPVALETSPRATPLAALDWPRRPLLVIGNEVAGVGPGVLEACPLHVGIPMRGVKQSFNVAVAFGIAAHHVACALERSAPPAATIRAVGP